jgi:hypothetical protein
MFILECFVSAAPDRESGWGLEFCRPLWVRTWYPDSPWLCLIGRRSGRRRHVRICVEVTPSVVSAIGGVEPASLASMARVTSLVSS